MGITGDSSGAKSYGLFICLLLIMAIGVANLFWPRTPTISTDAIKGITVATEQLQRVADGVEKSTTAMSDLNRALILQTSTRNSTNDQGYNKLLEQYGINVGEPADVSVAERVLERSNDLGGGHVPPGKGATNSDSKLQKPSNSGAPAANGSAAGTPGVRQGNAP